MTNEQSDTAPLVQLNDAGAYASSRWLVRHVDLAVSPGEIVTLIGPNGSGKSTTAKMALGLIQASQGQATRRDGLRVGYVPQKLAIDWTLPLTVSRFMRLTDRLEDDVLQGALEEAGIGHLATSSVTTLSGGEFQRMLLARAIARKPDLLVLDEPVQGVDYSGETAIYDLIGDVRDRLGCGVILISHDLHVVMAQTDKVVCLNGHVCCQGSPIAVSQHSEYLRLFGERAAKLAVYAHDHDHTHLPDGRVVHADGSTTDHCHPDDGHHHDHASHGGGGHV